MALIHLWNYYYQLFFVQLVRILDRCEKQCKIKKHINTHDNVCCRGGTNGVEHEISANAYKAIRHCKNQHGKEAQEIGKLWFVFRFSCKRNDRGNSNHEINHHEKEEHIWQRWQANWVRKRKTENQKDQGTKGNGADKEVEKERFHLFIGDPLGCEEFHEMRG
jgi:hypothetical protein